MNGLVGQTGNGIRRKKMNNEERINELKEKRTYFYHKSLELKLLADESHRNTHELYLKYNNADRDWRETDRQLAMLDGRYKVVDSASAKQEKSKKDISVDLTEEQIDAIALQLGIKLEDVKV
jgi:hypothetical protein